MGAAGWLFPVALRLFLFWTSLASQSAAAQSQKVRCRFPQDWKGHYYQSGVGSIVIRDTSVTTKGNCIDQNQDYFLFSNRDNRCVQCLLMIRRHPNIIQYKESFCINPDSLRKVCMQIRVETPLHTLIRDPATPSSCPFKDAFYFNYNDHLHGNSCDQPISYAKPCVGRTKYQLHFKQCSMQSHIPVVDTGRDVDLECLATWKDGSESFLYSRLTSSANPSLKDDQYRCLKYQYVGTEVLMAMSADATCRGLRTPTDGPYIMVFRKDEFGWSSPNCQFPVWLRSITWWRDVDGKNAYRSDVAGHVLTSSKMSSAGRQRHPLGEHSCAQALKGDDVTGVTFRTLSTAGCISKQQCVKFVQRSLDVVEFSQGTWLDSPTETAVESSCILKDDSRSSQILIPDESVMFPCPSPTLLAIRPSNGGQQLANSSSSSSIHCITSYRFHSCANDTWRTTTNEIGCSQGATAFDSHRCWMNADGLVYVVVKENSGSSVTSRLNTCARQASSSSIRDDSRHTEWQQASSTVDLKSLPSLVFLRLGNSNIYRSTSSTGNRISAVISSAGDTATSASLSRGESNAKSTHVDSVPVDGRLNFDKNYDDNDNVDDQSDNEDGDDLVEDDDDVMPASGDESIIEKSTPSVVSSRYRQDGGDRRSFPGQSRGTLAKGGQSPFPAIASQPTIGNQGDHTGAADSNRSRAIPSIVDIQLGGVPSRGNQPSSVAITPRPPGRRTTVSHHHAPSKSTGNGNMRTTSIAPTSLSAVGYQRRPASSSSSASSPSRRNSAQGTSGCETMFVLLRTRLAFAYIFIVALLSLRFNAFDIFWRTLNR